MFDPSTKILVVDDMLTMRKIVSKNLRDFGFTSLVEASDGLIAWDTLDKAAGTPEPFNLVVSDWNMPNCSGLEFLKKVRADSRFTKLPFILLTAEAEAHQIKEALSSGVSNYIIKPFTPDTLKQKLEVTHKKMAGG